MKSKPIIVGDWTIDPLSGEMTGRSGRKHLEPKVMQVLMYLVENAGDVLTRDEILAAVWGSRSAVSDEPLTRCITVLRNALGDSAGKPKYIRTVPKIGYALIAPVTASAAAAARSVSPPGNRESAAGSTGGQRWFERLSRRSLVIVVALLLIAVFALSLFDEPPQPAVSAYDLPGRASVAVLPFKTGSGADSADYLGAGIAAEVRLLLGQIRELRVAAGRSSAVFADNGADLRAIANGLGVGYVLDGTVQRDGNQLQVYVQLNSGADGFQLWSEKYQFESSGLFETQTRIANSVVDALVETLALPNQVPRFDVVAPTESIEAYDLYLRGKQFLNLRTPPDLDSAIEMFQAAIDIDPGYGMPYVAMAYAVSLGPASQAMADTSASFERSREILRDARDKDPSVADAALGIEAFIDLREGRLASAFAAYRRSLDVFPSEPILHHGVSLLMSTVGRHEEALEHANIARDLDPQSPIAIGRLAVSHLWLGRNADAEEYFNSSLDLGLDTVQNLQAQLLLLLRLERFEEARALGRRLENDLGSSMPWWDAFVDAAAGRITRQAALASIEPAADMEQTLPIMQLGAWAILGEDERALDVLEQILADNPTSIGGFLFSAELARLRQNSRFGAILTASPIYAYWTQYSWSPLCRQAGDAAIECQ